MPRDPFTPLPLPPRPLYQESDIVERGAAARTRDIETRSYETTETGRLEMERSREQSRLQYRADLTKAGYDYEDAMRNPIGNLIASLPKMALGIYQQIQDANQERYKFAETSRLTTQLLESNMRMSDRARKFMARVRDEDMTMEDVSGYIAQGFQEESGLMEYNESKDLWVQELNFKYQTLWTEDVHRLMRSVLDKADSITSARQAEKGAESLSNSFGKMVELYRQAPTEEEAAEVLTHNAARITELSGQFSPLSGSGGAAIEYDKSITGAMIDRLTDKGYQAFIDARSLLDEDGQHHFTVAQALVESDKAIMEGRGQNLQDPASSPGLWWELARRCDSQGQLQNCQNDVIRRRNLYVDMEMGAEKLIDDGNRQAFYQADVQGKWEGKSGTEMYRILNDSGFSPEFAHAEGKRINRENADALQLNDSRISELHEEALDERMSFTELAYLQQLQQNPGSSGEVLAALSQGMFQGTIRRGSDPVKRLAWWSQIAQAAQADLSKRYQPERDMIPAWISSLSTFAIDVGGTLYLERRDNGALVPLSSLESKWEVWLADAIANGTQIPDEDGNMVNGRFTPQVPGPEGGEPGGMTNELQMHVRRDLANFNLKGSVGPIRFNLAKLPPEVQNLLGGENRIYQESATFERNALVGSEAASARRLLEKTRPELTDEFDRRAGEDQMLFALRSIPWEAYTPGQTVDEATATLGRNMVLAEQLQQAAVLYDIRVDPRSGAMTVMVVPGGSWHPVLQESQEIKMRIGNLMQRSERSADLYNSKDDDLNAIDGAFVEIEDPRGIDPPARMPSQWSYAVQRDLEQLTAILADAVPHMSELIDRLIIAGGEQVLAPRSGGYR